MSHLKLTTFQNYISNNFKLHQFKSEGKKKRKIYNNLVVDILKRTNILRYSKGKNTLDKQIATNEIHNIVRNLVIELTKDFLY